MYRDMLVWLVWLNVLALLCVIFPDGVGVVHWPLGDKADPFSPAPAVIRPEWYFMFAFQTLKLIPAHVLFIEGELVGVLGFMVGGLIWALIPFFDTETIKTNRAKAWQVFGIIVVAFMVVMTALGYILK
jgi:quinol-cytochrome oxidoreductase complex cytochrome b subunit